MKNIFLILFTILLISCNSTDYKYEKMMIIYKRAWIDGWNNGYATKNINLTEEEILEKFKKDSVNISHSILIARHIL